ncbi:MAG: hypothetical protein NTY01_04210 [Verrucomicrobia bacterium]|nr:hypothetical protein [Verrucomicrobiota bacterium]
MRGCKLAGLCRGGGGQLRRRLRAIVELNAMSEETKQQQPSASDYKAFDFLWQHLRRSNYRKAWSEYQQLSRKCEALEPTAKQEKTKRVMELAEQYNAGKINGVELRREREKETPAEVELRKVCDRQRGIPLAIEFFNDLPSLPDNGAGSFLDPREEDSRKVLDEIVAKRPGYLETWGRLQAARLQADGVAASWNWRGSEGSAWQLRRVKVEDKGLAEQWKKISGETGPVAPCFHPVGAPSTFENLEMWLAMARQEGDSETVAKCEANMAKFLREHSQMDFVLDTSLPVETVVGELRRELGKIKRLRASVKLPRNEKRGRLRDWEKHLELYDAVLPQRERNKTAWRIWHEGLSFADAFKLLNVEQTLSDDERKLFQELDQRGRKPRDVFKAYVKESRRGKKTDVEYGFDARGDTVPTVDFDYAAVELRVNNATVTVAKNDLPNLAGQLDTMLAVWLPHFTWSKYRWPARFAKKRSDTLRGWMQSAEERIQAAWREV